MPNNPIQTFRAVEPANFGFGSTATLASQPFVLYYGNAAQARTSGSTSGTTVITAPSLTTPLLASRFQPWTIRNQDNHFPVKVPNAYDRLYVFPMYVVSTTNFVLSGESVPTSFSTASWPTGYTAPIVMPFGRFPQSKDNSPVGPSTIRCLPRDLILKETPSASTTPDFSNEGIWTALPPYATFWPTNNALATTLGSFGAPVSTPRSTASAVGIGAGYQLPPDLSVGANTTAGSAVTNAASVFAATLNSASSVFVGAGLEFSTMGCEEIVLSHLASATNLPVVTMDAQTGASSVGSGKIHYFLVGVFLG